MTATQRHSPFTFVPLFRLCLPVMLTRCAAKIAVLRRHLRRLLKDLVARNFRPPLPPLKKFGQYGPFQQGGAGGSCGNPWKPVDATRKSLIHTAKCSTGLHFFYTSWPQYSTYYPVFSTSHVLVFFALFLCISFFLKEKKNKKRRKRENSPPRETTIAYFLIHGLSALFRPTRGYPWKQLSFEIIGLSDKIAPSTGPRVNLPPGGENRG